MIVVIFDGIAIVAIMGYLVVAVIWVKYCCVIMKR